MAIQQKSLRNNKERAHILFPNEIHKSVSNKSKWPWRAVCFQLKKKMKQNKVKTNNNFLALDIVWRLVLRGLDLIEDEHYQIKAKRAIVFAFLLLSVYIYVRICCRSCCILATVWIAIIYVMKCLYYVFVYSIDATVDFHMLQGFCMSFCI